MNVQVRIEPELVNDRTAAAVLSISPRSFAELVRRGDVRPVRVPGMRRTAYLLSEVRQLARRWRADRDGAAFCGGEG